MQGITGNSAKKRKAAWLLALFAACGMAQAQDALPVAQQASAEEKPAEADNAQSPVAPVVDDQQMQQADAAASDEAASPQSTATDTLGANDARAEQAAGDLPAATAQNKPALPMRGVLFRISRVVSKEIPAAEENEPQEADTAEQAETTAPEAENAAFDAAEDVDALLDGAALTVVEETGPASYLLATIHFGTEGEQGVDYPALEKRIAEAAIFVNEVDEKSEWLPEYLDHRWLAVNKPLSRMIGREGFEMASALLPAIKRNDLERSKPWAVLALLEARGETASDDGMDARLGQMARVYGLKRVHLETLGEQLKALDCVPVDEQAEVLRQRLQKPWVMSLESSRALRFYRERNLDAWLADIDRMDGLDESAKPIEQRARECLLDERNRRWLPQIEKLLEEGPVFIAVGAMHLAGEHGLVAALRRAGWQVEAEPY